MAKRESTCLVCGRAYTDYDAAPRFFCSVACEADAGGPVHHDRVHYDTGRGRPARVGKRVRKGGWSGDPK